MKHFLSPSYLLRTAIVAIAAMACSVTASAQIGSNWKKVQETSKLYHLEYNNYTFTPRLGSNGQETHWTKWRKKLQGTDFGDTFQENVTEWPSDPANDRSAPMQATHVVRDTLYVKKGQWIRLLLPNTMGDNEAASYYIRWYSYRTNSALTFDYDGKNYSLIENGRNGSSRIYKNRQGYFSGTAFGGKVGQNMSRANFYYPTDREFEEWGLANASQTTHITNSHYIIVCDVTMYADERVLTQGDGGNGGIAEPTLSQRTIYYISGIDDNVEDFKNDYESPKQDYKGISFWDFVYNSPYVKTGNQASKDDPWYEEYEIDFPYRRFYSNAGGDVKAEMLALMRDARYSFLPGATWGRHLKVTLDPGNSGIKFHNTTDDKYKYISDTEIHVSGGGTNDIKAALCRVMPFEYPNTEGNSSSSFYRTQTVNAPDTHAYIYVQDAEGRYNLVRYRINFRANNMLLAQKDIDAIERGTAGEELKRYEARTPKYLREHYKLAASLNFNLKNDLAVNNVQKNGDGTNKYYPFPRQWDRSGYGFYDGYISNKTSAHDYGKGKPQWGHYGIVSDYVWDAIGKPEKRPSDYPYWLYIDASDLPNEVARLSFEDQELCEGAELFVSAFVKNAKEKREYDDFAAVFTLIGENTNEKGEVTETKALHKFSTGQVPRTYFMSERYGNEDYWIQVYTSFIMGKEKYDHYYLQIENNAYSTEGADYYIDHVNVYVNQTSVQAKQISPTCSEPASKMRILVNYDQTLSRIGMDERSESQAVSTDFLSFAFVDSLELAKYEETHGKVGSVPAELLKPFRFYKGLDEAGPQDEEKKFATLHFSNDFPAMTREQAYAENFSSMYGQAPATIATESGDQPSWRAWDTENETGGGRQRYLAIDVSAELEGGRTYYLVMSDARVDEAGGMPSFSMDEICDIYAPFKVTSTSALKVNGDVIGSEADFCSGQVNTFSVELTAFVDGEQEKVPEEYSYFDWYLGSLDDYNKKDAGTNDDGKAFTLFNAVDVLRQHYPFVTTLDDVTPQPETEARLALTQEMIDALRAVVEPTDGSAPKLYLRRKELSVRVTDGMGIVAHPIPFVLGEGTDKSYLFCFDPVSMTLTANSNAPQAFIGFDDATYPDGYDPALRLGLQHLGTGSDITVPLRGVAHANEGESVADHLDMIGNQRGVYVISTDDPQWSVSNQFEHSIGTLEGLNAKFGQRNNFVRIKLNIKSNAENSPSLREGFTYNLVMYAREGSENDNKCYATIYMPVKVVPKYLRWLGSSTSNWNDDANWRRSTKAELRNPADYIDYADVSQQNFVPMYFSKVTMPKDSQMATYEPGTKHANIQFNGNSLGNVLNLDLTTQPRYVEEAAQMNIEYDLEVGEPDLRIYPYHSNVINELHLEPRTEVFGKNLTYNQLWTDYLLKTNEWHLLSSPLPDVVAGDFYAPKDNGRQETPYFDNITFGTQNSNYDRFGPAIYQRGWGEEGQHINYQQYSSSTTKQMTVAATQWSAAFNDVSASYAPGTGFSLKPTKGLMKNPVESVLVRLPKQDDRYYYWSQNGSMDKMNAFYMGTSHANHGTSPSTSMEQTYEIALTAKSQYLLLGNPYLSSLDMRKVMELNKDNFEQKYWTVNNGNQTAAVATDDGTWTTIGAEGNYLIGPRQGFIVKLKSAPATSGTEVTFRFNEDLGDLSSNVLSPTTSAPAYSPEHHATVLTLHPADGSAAVVNVEASASTSFEATEDAELLLDTNLGADDHVQAYTTAGDRAASVNATPSADGISVGVLGRKGESITVSISGAEGLSLYDAVTKQTTELSADTTVVVMEGDAVGRYFLRSSSASIGGTASDPVISATALGNGRLVVSTTGPSLGDIAIHSAHGRQVARTSETSRSHEFTLPAGVYIISPARLKVRVE